MTIFNALRSAAFAAATAGLLALAPAAAQATAYTIDFGDGVNNTNLGNSHTYTVDSTDVIAASAFETTGAGSLITADLWLRNDGANDKGLGVCSSGEGTNCGAIGGSGHGDFNELSNEDTVEAIFLQNLVGGRWTHILLSSLDSNDDATDVENGTIIWGDNETLAGAFEFTNGDFGSAVNGDLFSIPDFVAVFDPTAQFIAFRAGGLTDDAACGAGCNNDYLIAGASIDTVDTVPEPATLAAFGIGLVGMGFAGRRRKG